MQQWAEIFIFWTQSVFSCFCVLLLFQLGCKEITEDCLMMYLEHKPPPNQFLCRAYFCQAQLNLPRTVASVVSNHASWIHQSHFWLILCKEHVHRRS